MVTSVGVNDISVLIGRIYDAALDKSRWSEFLSDLGAAFNSPCAMITDVHACPKGPPNAVTMGLDLGIIADWRDCCEHVDVWYQALASQKVEPAYFGRELVPTRQLVRSGFYADILKPHNIMHCVGGLIEESPQDKWIFAVYRGDGPGQYTHAERAVFRALTPHFRRSLAMSQEIADLAATRDALAAGLERAPFGLVIFDSAGRGRHVNQVAHKLFALDDGLTLLGGQPRAWRHEDQQALDASIARAVKEPDPEGPPGPVWLTVARPSGQLPIQVLICPINGRSDHPASRIGGAAMMLIRQPGQASGLSAEMIMAIYSLTKAEAGLCVALYEGGSLTEVADRLGISRNTAKTHLRNIFQKLQMSSQTELIRELALGIAAQT